MLLYNTLTKLKEPFRPLGEPVRMYVCGVTPYDTTHLGHARTYALFDVLHRYLRYLGHQVRYVQNITDVDEPLFQRARELAISYVSLAAQNVATYFEDMAALHVLPADRYPRASEEIPDMIRMIAGLLARGHAYRREGVVFFRISSDPSYGELSGLSRAEMATLSAEQGNDLADPRKEDPLDFVLWQPSAPAEPSWPSPWGHGRPGWHIECSTMAMKYLGERIDIHGGGEDLIYPHHEDEIAQSEGYSGVRPFSRFWLHTGMVRLGGVKMSKSLGNLAMVRNLLRRYSADAIRLYLLSYPYREPFDFLPERLARAETLVQRLRDSVYPTNEESACPFDASPYRDRFLAALDDDLDTPGAIDVLLELGEAMSGAREVRRDVAAAKVELRALAAILGIVALS